MIRGLIKNLTLFLLVFFLLVTAGCTKSEKVSIPLLPANFENALIPDVDIEGYLYLNQSTPLNVSSGALPGFIMRSFSIWLGPEVKAVAGAVELSDEAAARSLIEQVQSDDKPPWTLTRGNIVYMTPESGIWAAAVQDAINNQNVVSLTTRYPDIWENFNHFPATPPAKPFAAGFLKLDSQLVDSIGPEIDIPLIDIVPILETARVDSICFVLYTQRDIEINEETAQDFLQEPGIGAIIVGRSGYPDFLIGFLFDRAAQGAGLEKDSVEGINIFSYPLKGLEMLVAREGNILYGAIAQSRTMAEQLLLSALR